jgi:hypothetical protein
VHVIADEATNFKVAGLADIMTWGRGYGIRLLLIIQDLAAFRRTYGKDAGTGKCHPERAQHGYTSHHLFYERRQSERGWQCERESRFV